MLLIVSVFLVACGNESDASTKESDEQSEETTSAKNDKQEDLQVEVKNSFYKKYHEESFSMDQLGIYAELKNNTDKFVTLIDVEVSLYDKDDNIISVLNDESVDNKMFAPEVITKNGTTYMAIQLDYEDKYDDIDNIEIKYDVEEVNEFAYNDMETDKVNVTKGERDNLDITMKVSNANDEDLDYELGIGFYDKDDKFLGSVITYDYDDVSRLVKANDDKNIEINESLDIDMDKVDRTEVIASGYLPEFED